MLPLRLRQKWTSPRMASALRTGNMRPTGNTRPHKDERMLRRTTPTVSIRASIPGRMRLQVEALRDRPRKAAAVAMAVRQAPGILEVEATPRTARLLVRYDPRLPAIAAATLVRTALITPPLSLEAYRAQQTVNHHAQEQIGRASCRERV